MAGNVAHVRGPSGQYPQLTPEISGDTAESNMSVGSGEEGLPTAFGALRAKMLQQVQQIQVTSAKPQIRSTQPETLNSKPETRTLEPET